MRFTPAVLLLAAFIMSPSARASVLQVSINTSSLSGSPGSLAFDFVDGGPPSNSLTISGFSSNGTLGSATLTGGASGMLPGTVQLTDSSFFNEYLTGFTFGTTILFRITANLLPPAAGSSPDEFSFYLLNPAGTASLVTTSDPTGANALFTIDSTGTVSVFSSSAMVNPVGAPEPASVYLLLGAIAVLVFRCLRPRVRSGACACATAVMLLALWNASANAQGPSFAKIVDQSTARPDGQGNFNNPHFPSTDGRYVVWNEVSGDYAIWSKDLVGGNLIRLADLNTPVPGGSGNFTGFGQNAGGIYNGFGIAVRSGLVAFLGSDAAFNNTGQGLFSTPANGGAIQRIVNYNTVLPNGGVVGTPSGGIFAIGLNDSGSVVFNGQTAGNAPDNTPLGASVYTAASDGSNLTLIADGDHQFRNAVEPAGPNNTCSGVWSGVGIGGNTVVYIAGGRLDFGGIYALPVTGPAQGLPPSSCGSGPIGPLVIGSGTPLPGDPCTQSCIPAYDFVQTDGQTVFFHAVDGRVTNWSGIYSIPLAGGSVTKIVEVGDTLPAIGTVTVVHQSFSVDNGGVVFLVQNTGANPERTGIFLYQGGQISKVLAYGDTLDGTTVGPNTDSFEIWPESYKNGKLAFIWGRFFGTAVYVASFCASDVSSQVTVSRSGFRFNRATGTFVQQVTLTNSGNTTVSGPMELVIENLSANVTLANASGTSACLAPGSPFITVPLGVGDSLAPGGSVSITLSFSNPSRGAIMYQTAVAAGSATP